MRYWILHYPWDLLGALYDMCKVECEATTEKAKIKHHLTYTRLLRVIHIHPSSHNHHTPFISQSGWLYFRLHQTAHIGRRSQGFIFMVRYVNGDRMAI